MTGLTRGLCEWWEDLMVVGCLELEDLDLLGSTWVSSVFDSPQKNCQETRKIQQYFLAKSLQNNCQETNKVQQYFLAKPLQKNGQETS